MRYKIPYLSEMRSKFEKKIAKDLHSRGIKYEYEPDQLEYEEPLRKNLASCGECGSSNLVRTGWYTPDFRLPSGMYIETKGRFTAADRRKHLAVRKAHPDVEIVMLFMRDNRIHKNSKTYYSDWCMQHNIDFAIGELKEEWLQ